MELSRVAFARPHVLLIESPGGTAARLALERVLRERSWPLTDSPADADVLAIAGAGLQGYAGRVWDQLPGPRARVDLVDQEQAGPALDGAQQTLLARAAQREDATTRPLAPSSGPAHDMPAGHDMPESHEMPAGHDMPGGLDMAGRAPDRDGLQLDVLHVPLGPALPWWPAGLVLRSRLQGDVLAAVEVSWVGATRPATPFWMSVAESAGPARTGAAARLDSLTRLLAVAGWEAERLRAQRVRDELLAHEVSSAVRARLNRLVRRVGRSAVLARMTRGLGEHSGSDVTGRYRSWLAELAELAEAADHRNVRSFGRHGAQIYGRNGGASLAPDRLAELLAGTEVSSARLIVASLDAWLTDAVVAGAERV